MDSIKEWVGAYLERTGTTKAELANQMSISRTSFYNKMDGTTEFSGRGWKARVDYRHHDRPAPHIAV